MKRTAEIIFQLSDVANGVAVSPSAVPVGLLRDFAQDVSRFVVGSQGASKFANVTVAISEGSLVFGPTVPDSDESFDSDVALLDRTKIAPPIDAIRLQVLRKWQADVRKNPDRIVVIAEREFGKVRPLLHIDRSTNVFSAPVETWLEGERYVHATVIESGGKSKSNLHIELDTGQTLIVQATRSQIEQATSIHVYHKALLHIAVEENLDTGELRNARLLRHEAPAPGMDEEEARRLHERGDAAWSKIGNVTEWIEELRGHNQ